MRRELLLDAARRCLGKKGLKGFNLRNVAREAKVSIGLIGHYFGGIDELLQAVFDSVMFELPRLAAQEPQTAEAAADNLREVVARNFSPDYYSRGNLLIWLPIYEEMMLSDSLRRKLVAQDQRYVDEVAVHIARVAKLRGRDVDAQALAGNFLAFLDGLWLRWCFSGRAGTEREQDTAYRYLEAALGPLRTP